MESSKKSHSEEHQKKMRQLITDLRPKKFGRSGKIWLVLLGIMVLTGIYSYVQQLSKGLVVTDMHEPFVWGIYVSTFVFFVALSLVGSLISAILKLLDVNWRHPLTRISEIIALSAILLSIVCIIVDMGRPDRILNLVLYGRLQSPIIWDVLVISTYLVISTLLFYIPLLPDLALCRDYYKTSNKSLWKSKFYEMMALGWQGKPAQFAMLNRSVKILAVLVIPVALGVHTVTSWLFSTTYSAGWDSTNFGPYFVSGAFLLGTGGMIVAMYILRRQYALKKYIKAVHFDKMGKLLVLTALIYLYFNINEYFMPVFKMKKMEVELMYEMFYGRHAFMFWIVMVAGIIVPIVIFSFKKGRQPFILFLVSIVVVVCGWLKRVLIVTPILMHPLVPIQNQPEGWSNYSPTFEEWSITVAAFAGSILIMMLLIRIFPIIPIWEEAQAQSIPRHKIKFKPNNE